MNSTIDVLWFDDDLTPERQAPLKPWRMWFLKAVDDGKIQLRTCATTREFAAVLSDGSASVDLLILDVVLDSDEAETLAAFGFPRERLQDADAGLQLLDILKNGRHAKHRPPWLERHTHVPVAILTNVEMVAASVDSTLDSDRASEVEVLMKSVEWRGDGKVVAGADFPARMEALLTAVRELKARAAQ